MQKLLKTMLFINIVIGFTASEALADPGLSGKEHPEIKNNDSVSSKARKDNKEWRTKTMSLMKKSDWNALVSLANLDKKNATINLVPYRKLKELLWVQTFGENTQLRVACVGGASAMDIHFAAFESKFHYFVLSYPKDERMRSSHPNWHVCRKKDNVRVFDLWSASWAMESPKDGIVDGHGCGMYGPETRAVFSHQKGREPALSFKSVICRGYGEEQDYTVFFDSKGVSRIESP